MFERTSTQRKQAHHASAGSPPRPVEDARVARSDPLALDPYSPIFPIRRREWNDPDPVALDPYSPILPARASDPSRRSDSNG